MIAEEGSSEIIREFFWGRGARVNDVEILHQLVARNGGCNHHKKSEISSLSTFVARDSQAILRYNDDSTTSPFFAVKNLLTSKFF